MAGKVIGIALAAVLVALFCTGAAGQSDGCDSVIVTLAPCLPYVQGDAPIPTQPCCGQLGNVVRNTPRCLCLLVKGGGPVPINVTRALALPSLCKVKTPPVSKCDEAKSPASPPSDSTAPSTPSRPSIPSGSSSIPSGSSSGGSSNKSVHSMLFVILFIATCVSSFTNL